MGSSLSPIVANLVMESIEQEALTTFTFPVKHWRRYVDDTFVILKT
jgi:hypothetical protein